jgi:CHAT domain-containing protein/tetratricopeptide (TPR) repeat protein
MLLSVGFIAARADDASDLAALNKQALQLHGRGKYKEAAAIAEKALALAERTLGSDHPNTLICVNNLGFMHVAEGRYDKAEPLYKRALAAKERVRGPEHPDTLTSVNNLAELYRTQGRYAEAEPLHRRALAGRERALGAEDPKTLTSVNNLAILYEAQGRYDEAEPLYKRAMEALGRTLGAEHPNTLSSMNNLAGLYETQGRYDEAELLYRRTLESRERALGPEHPATLTSVSNLASLYRAKGRYAEAEPLYRRAMEVRERVLGGDHPDTLTSANNLAGLYQLQGRYAEAEPLLKRALTGYEHSLGTEHPSTLIGVSNLAALYKAQERYGEAEPLYRRALDARERVLGREHPDTLTSLNNLAALYQAQGRHKEAEPLYQRTLGARERALGPDHPDTLTTINDLAELYRAQGRYREAEPLYRRAFDSKERVLGPDHPSTLTSLNNLAVLYQRQGRYAEAEPLHRRALDARERVLGSEHEDTLVSLNNLAALHLAQHHWREAAQFWRRSTAALIERTQRGAPDAGQPISGKQKSDAERESSQFRGLVKAEYRSAPDGKMPDAALSREMFQIAQWALGSEAAQSLAQMASRGSSGDPKLAALVRERQDLVAEWQKREALRNAALGEKAARRNAKTEAANDARMADIDKRLAKIDKGFAATFPNYAALASPAPLTADEVQAQLGADEALVLFFDTREWQTTPEETFIWVLTKTDIRWVRSDLGTDALTREVQDLRCGLDAAAWEGVHCAKLTGQNDPGGSPPFDRARAHRLYQALFGQVEDLIKGKHLLIVPAGPLTQLPFQVLVTAPPPAAVGDYRSTAWLIRDHALTVLPAVSSLKALRRVGRPSIATKPLIGFGNPLLDGPDSRYADYAKRARMKQSCSKTVVQRVLALLEARRGVQPVERRSGLADISALRALAPLPETADELCAVAQDVGADAGEIHLGANATEHEVKALSRKGDLARYRIVHFATHGAMAGELDGSSEPGLILTPPTQASEEDDGYLSASEIAGLKLNADWVILSACNTAAGATSNAEALSGLARAFIYAQARALLVSHWAVDSNATVQLITTAMREIARDKAVGRSEALRRAMLALIDSGDPQTAHPGYWAPFIVVGEGRR